MSDDPTPSDERHKAACGDCAALFSPPPLGFPAPPGWFAKLEQRFCPECLPRRTAELDQREAEAARMNRETCEREGHAMFNDGMTGNHCLRCGARESEMSNA